MAKREIPKVAVQARERLGKRYTARLRKTGQLPAVIYGRQKDPVHVVTDAKQFGILLHRSTHLVEVQINGGAEPCLIKDVQFDHLGAEVIHVDLARVDLTQRVRLEVDLVLTGEAVGLKETGTILEQFHSKIEIECLATEIPDNIKADVSHLAVDQSLKVSELKLPEGVTTTLGKDVIVAAVHVLAEEVVETPVAEGAVEPELIGKKPEEGAEGEAAPAAGAKPAAGAAAKAPAGEKKEAKK